MRRKSLWSLLVCSALLCIFAISVTPAEAQSAPAFPKYKVMGVVYAPPGSASSVTYGNSNLVGSTDTMSTTNSTTNTNSITVTAQTGIMGVFGVNASYEYSDGWTISQQNGSSLAIQTTQGNSVSTMGPISSSLGVDHDNDVIYIWLNPAITGTAATTYTPLNWGGISSNTCDPNNPVYPLTIDQAVSGCDPNQYPYPDIVGIPVWCLKNPYFPAQSCAQWLPYTSRSWDTSNWGNDANTGLPLGPGLTMRDYADILQADPFVLMNGTEVNVCHPTYGPTLDPNLTETVGKPLTPASVSVLRKQGGSYAGLNLADPYDPNYTSTTASATGFFPRSCGAATNMTRFQPYGAVEYPVPGPNGLASNYSGNFQYSQTQTNSTVATDIHTVSQTSSVGAWGTVPFFNASITAGFSNSTTWEQQSSTSSTSESTASAAYSITGPQLTDNYVGPATYNVYLDNVYGTYAFYSDLAPTATPTQLGNIGLSYLNASNVKVTCSPAGIVTGSTGSNAPCFSFPQTLTSLNGQIYSAEQTITLTNYSSYPVTLAGPAVTFSDPGFQTANGILQDGSDTCSNQTLNPNATCTVGVLFSPTPVDAPNTITGATTVVDADMVVAGTVNVSTGPASAPEYQNILVSNYSLVTGIAQPNASLGLVGATLLPVAVQNSNIPNAYIFPTQSNYTQTNLTEQFKFHNYSNSSVTFPAYPNDMVLSDIADFKVLNVTGNLDGCAGIVVASGGTCTVTLQFFPTTSISTGVYTTRITATSSSGTQLAFAGATGTATIPITVTNGVGLYLQSNNFNNLYVYGWATPVTIKNNTNTTVTLGTTTTPTYINDARQYSFSCEADAGSGNGNAYFSPCIYNSSATTTQPTGVGDLVSVTNSPVPQPWGYLFGQLSGTYTAETGAHGQSGSQPTLTCSANGVLSANTQCTAAIVAYLPVYPDDQGWDDIYFVNGVPEENTLGNTFVANFSIPLTATFTVAGNIPMSFATQITATVNGDNQTNQSSASVIITGTEKNSKVNVSATHAAAALTIKAAKPKASRPGTLAVKVGSFKATASYAAGATQATVQQALTRALNVKGSPVKAAENATGLSITSVGTGTAANLTVSIAGNASFGITASSKTLVGGKNATTSLKYDAGAVNLKTHGTTASAEWGSASTPLSVARALAASVNKMASTYWIATASGNTVKLTATPAGASKTQTSTSSNGISVSVSDSAGFKPESFSASTSN